MSSSRAVSHPGMPISDLAYTKRRRDPTVFHGLAGQMNLAKCICQNRDNNVLPFGNAT